MARDLASDAEVDGLVVVKQRRSPAIAITVASTTTAASMTPTARVATLRVITAIIRRSTREDEPEPDEAAFATNATTIARRHDSPAASA